MIALAGSPNSPVAISSSPSPSPSAAAAEEGLAFLGLGFAIDALHHRELRRARRAQAELAQLGLRLAQLAARLRHVRFGAFEIPRQIVRFAQPGQVLLDVTQP